jgi:hypothetical protein
MKSKIIAAIAFCSMPITGFSETPPEVWMCDQSGTSVTDDNTKALAARILESLNGTESNEEDVERPQTIIEYRDQGQTYFRPETREMWFEEDGWADLCNDGDMMRQVFLTDYGCQTVTRVGPNSNLYSTLFAFDPDSQEVVIRYSDFGEKSWSLGLLNLNNCKVVNPALFE